MNSKIPYFIDSVLSKFIAFLFCLTFGGYFCPTFTTSVVFSFVCSFCLSEIYLHFSGKRTSKKENENERAYQNFFLLKSEEENLSFFYELLRKKRIVIKKDGYLCFDSIALFCKLRHAPLTPDEVVFLSYLAERDNGKKAIILCNLADEKALSLVREDLKSTRIFTLEKVISVVEFFGGDDLVPKRKRNKKSFVSVVKSSVSKKKAKAYFFGSITLFFLSAVTSFSPYYLFFAVALFTLSIVSKAQKN